ncbi:MAG: hypothetical protein HOP19_27750, partial [Acidobacteria bacterium]|nr:hypothetical protein [Acidobacteriota bacterium]
MTSSQRGAFPFQWALSWSLLVGAIYFLPQAMHLWHTRMPSVLLEENLDEMAYAVWASRAAGEHSNQPDPYQVNQGKNVSVSFATVQPLPAWVIGNLARITRLPVTIIFGLGSFLWPAVIAFFFFVIAWLMGIPDRVSLTLSVVFSLLMLPPVLWLMQWRYVAALLADSYPGFRLTLPYSRRYQPQFTAVIHYACIAFSLMLLQAERLKLRRLAGIVAGLAFGLSFYCYYFSWTLLLGWFVLGGFFVWARRRERCKEWGMATLLGVLIAIPYFVTLARHFGDISSSAASARVRSLPSDPAIQVTLLICLLLAGVMWFDKT